VYTKREMKVEKFKSWNWKRK